MHDSFVAIKLSVVTMMVTLHTYTLSITTQVFVVVFVFVFVFVLANGQARNKDCVARRANLQSARREAINYSSAIAARQLLIAQIVERIQIIINQLIRTMIITIMVLSTIHHESLTAAYLLVSA